MAYPWNVPQPVFGLNYALPQTFNLVPGLFPSLANTFARMAIPTLAAFIDCEGTISVQTSGTATVELWQNNPDLLDIVAWWVSINIPGSGAPKVPIYRGWSLNTNQATRGIYSNGNARYQLLWCGIEAAAVITAAKPYLLRKYWNADAVLNYQNVPALRTPALFNRIRWLNTPAGWPSAMDIAAALPHSLGAAGVTNQHIKQYAAGFLDFDGGVCTSYSHPGSVHNCIKMIVRLTQTTCPPLLRWLGQRLGIGRIGPNPNSADLWFSTTRDLRIMFTEIALPWSLIKPRRFATMYAHLMRWQCSRSQQGLPPSEIAVVFGVPAVTMFQCNVAWGAWRLWYPAAWGPINSWET